MSEDEELCGPFRYKDANHDVTCVPCLCLWCNENDWCFWFPLCLTNNDGLYTPLVCYDCKTSIFNSLCGRCASCEYCLCPLICCYCSDMHNAKEKNIDDELTCEQKMLSDNICGSNCGIDWSRSCCCLACVLCRITCVKKDYDVDTGLKGELANYVRNNQLAYKKKTFICDLILFTKKKDKKIYYVKDLQKIRDDYNRLLGGYQTSEYVDAPKVDGME